MTPEMQLLEKVGQLEQLLLAKHPTMPTLLREIHTTIRKYPEQVTVLKPEDIGIIVRSLDVTRNNILAASIVKESTKKKSSTQALLDALDM